MPYHVGYTPAYATEYPGGGIQSQNDLYNNLHHHHQHNNQYMFNPYNAGQRLSTTDSYYQSGGVDYNPNMDPDPINDMYNHPRNNNSKSSIAGSRPRMTCQFLRTVGRQFYQTSCSVCSYKELWNFEHFFRTI